MIPFFFIERTAFDFWLRSTGSSLRGLFWCFITILVLLRDLFFSNSESPYPLKTFYLLLDFFFFLFSVSPINNFSLLLLKLALFSLWGEMLPWVWNSLNISFFFWSFNFLFVIFRNPPKDYFFDRISPKKFLSHLVSEFIFV